MATLATVPLEQLPLASLDLETTGLKPAQDRICQIGLVDPADESHCLDLLVDPGVPIPPSSTLIHGIDDAMVAGSSPFPLALPELRRMIGTRVILGFNIGFDLAVLTAEAERHGLEWTWHSALCLRQLATVCLGAEAMLVMGDLNALATHYGVDAEKRHTALGDALITGRIFRAMLPELKARSITTLADALRAVSKLDDLRLGTARAGWVDVAAGITQPAITRPLRRIDPFPYQHRISEMMLEKPLIMPPQTTVIEAATAMKKNRIDCVFVGTDDHHIEGIVSERDLVITLAIPVDEVETARMIELRTIMSSPVATVFADDFMHLALGRISRLDIRHLGVTNRDGVLVGWISTRELTRQRVSEALLIGDQLASAEGPEEMGQALASLPMLAVSLLDDGVDGHDIAAVISSQYRAALARAAALAETHMAASGRGTPPRDYTVLILGSAGRGESLLAADQDHAILFADSPDSQQPHDDEDVQAWFMELGGHIADYLDQAGIPYCKGGVMSREPKWCRSLSGWRKAISEWIKLSRPEDMLAVDIFFDLEPVWGDVHLATMLNQAMAKKALRRPAFLKSLAGNLGNSNAGSTIFGGLRTEGGRFNMKLWMLLPMVETLRVLAISRGITQRGSGSRATALHQTGSVPPEVTHLAEDIHFCLKLVLRQQISDISAGTAPGTMIDLGLLSDSEKQVLKTIRGRVSRLDTVLQDCLFS
ncbi:MAG: DUF294 nucleotidyltransferase-like domain-containing protein [Candidatus Puniceispirillales bacterium]